MSKKLREIIKKERDLYMPHAKTWGKRFMLRFCHEECYELFRWAKYMRKAEFFSRNSKTKIGKVRALLAGRKMNILGNRLGFFISTGCLGDGVQIYHKGDIIINYRSVIGDGCKLHGDNCIGNNGKDLDCPILGRNVDVGIGAKIIGGVTIADDIKIGANAVVTKSFLEPGITIAGVPARKIKDRED